jgi:hypothetical protein
MPAPQISPLPNPPSRSQSPDTFSTDADAFLGALPDFQEEANDQADYLDALAVDVTADAAAAEAAAVIAAGAANYQGDYNAAITYQIGESVSYSGRRYVAKTVNTGVTPVDGANWFIIAELPAPSTAGNLLTSDGTNWASLAPLGANLPVITRTSNIEIVANDKGKLIEYTAGGFTQTFASAAALGAGWWCYVYNKAIPQFETSGGWYNRGALPSGALQPTNITNAFLTDDGIYVYYLHASATNRGRIYRMQLGTAGNFATIQSTVQVFNADSQILAGGEAIHFRPDGLRMFVFAKPSGASQTTVFVYILTTPWDISSGVTYSGTSFTFDLTSTIDARMSNNGTRVYISNSGNIRQYNLGTAWDFTSVTTASTTTINPPVTFNQSFLFNRDGTKLFVSRIVGSGKIAFFQYNLSTAWEVSTRSFYGSMGADLDPSVSVRGNGFYSSSAGIFAVAGADTTNNALIDFALDPQGNLLTAMANQSSGDITLDPNGVETIDGRSSFISYAGELRLITSDGSNLKSAPLKGFNRVFTSSTYFTPPTGYSAFSVECLGAGGGASDGNSTVSRSGAGGGGGAYSTRMVRAELLRSSSLLISVGAGGTRGNPSGSNGGASFFGAYCHANGGRPGSTNGGYGGGIYMQNINQPNAPTAAWSTFGSGRGGYGTTDNTQAMPSIYGGGGGGQGINNVSAVNASTSVYGGGGGSSGTGTSTDDDPNSGGRRTVTFGAALSDDSLTQSFLTERWGGGAFGAQASLGASATLRKIGDGGGGSGTSSFVGGDGGLGGGGGGGNFSYGTGLGSAGGNGGNGLVVVQGII